MDYPRKKESEKMSVDEVVPEKDSRVVDCIRSDIHHHNNKGDNEEEKEGTISRGIARD